VLQWPTPVLYKFALDFSEVEAAVEQLKPIWETAREIVTFAVLLWALVIVGWALFRLPKIVEALRHFGELRTPIWDLRTSVQSLMSMDIKGQLTELQESVEAAQAQLKEMQRQSVDERTEPLVVPDQPLDSQSSDDWEAIRIIWGDARDRLEAIITRIRDGRIKRKYDGIARYNYKDVIRTLYDDQLINVETRNISQQMNDTFLLYRRRTRPVTPEIVQQFKKWKADFDRNTPLPKTAQK
jgi:hypothetical protein